MRSLQTMDAQQSHRPLLLSRGRLCRPRRATTARARTLRRLSVGVIAFLTLGALSHPGTSFVFCTRQTWRVPQILRRAGTAEGEAADPTKAPSKEAVVLTAAEVEKVGNLVEDDEWLGLGMELAIVLRSAVRESLKGSVRDFVGKDTYEFGDLSKETDARVKAAVAELRGKSEYEVGDLSLALDKIAKDEVCKLTGKEPGEYEFGDLSIEVDKRVKSSVAVFCGKDTYEVGDLSREIGARTASAVAEFTGRGTYTFGDVSKEIEQRRVTWVQYFLGKQEYKFGDISKKFIADFTGKADYEFGDITKKAVASFTGKEEYQFGDITKSIGEALFGNKKPKKD